MVTPCSAAVEQAIIEIPITTVATIIAITGAIMMTEEGATTMRDVGEKTEIIIIIEGTTIGATGIGEVAAGIGMEVKREKGKGMTIIEGKGTGTIDD